MTAGSGATSHPKADGGGGGACTATRRHQRGSQQPAPPATLDKGTDLMRKERGDDARQAESTALSAAAAHEGVCVRYIRVRRRQRRVAVGSPGAVVAGCGSSYAAGSS